MIFNTKKIFVLLTIFLIGFANLDAKSKSKKEKKSQIENIEPPQNFNLKDATSIALPEKRERGFFDSIDPEALLELEKGSPQLIKNAVSKIRRASADYSETERIFLEIARSIMQICWPSAKVSWEDPAAPQNNPYIGAILSAKNDIYDTSTGNSDFFTLTLPSLVLLTENLRSDYYKESEIALKQALELQPDSIFASYLLGVLFRRMEKYDLALEIFQKIYKQCNDVLEIARALSECYNLAGKSDSAYNLASLYLAVDPQNLDFLKLCAQTAFDLKDFDNAEQYAARVLQQEPENALYILFRAQILIEKKEYIKASPLLDVYARTDSNSKLYLILRARIQRDWNRNTQAAVATLENAISLYPNDADVILLAAQTISGTSEKIGEKNALELAEAVLQNNAENPLALKIKITELIHKKNFQSAYETSAKLLKILSSNGANQKEIDEASFTHIDVCLSSEKIGEAFHTANEIYLRDPKNENVIQQYLKVLVASNRKTEASRLISSLLPTASARQKSFFYYERSFLTENEDQILSELRASLTANPRNTDSLFRLYTIYFKKKEYRKAQYYLRQVIALNPGDEELIALNRELEQFLK